MHYPPCLPPHVYNMNFDCLSTLLWQKDIDLAVSVSKRSLQVCNGKRRKLSVMQSLGAQRIDNYTDYTPGLFIITTNIIVVVGDIIIFIIISVFNIDWLKDYCH